MDLLIGAVLGFLSGLGVGGGSLLMLWLTGVLGCSLGDARAINLLFFLPASLLACVLRWKRQKLDWKTILPAAVSGCILAAVTSYLAGNFKYLKKLYGGLLIAAGIRELWVSKKQGH